MAGWDGAGSIHALRMRLTRLDATGAPVVGSSTFLTTSALTKVSYAPQYADGEEIESRNGGGDICVFYQAPPILKAVEVKVELCTPDPQAEELLSGGVVISSSGTPIGYQAPDAYVDPMPNGMSLEVWSRAVVNGRPATTNPYIHWVFPLVKNWQQDEASIENDVHNPAFTGLGFENPNWEPPEADWTFDSGRLWQYARVAALPTVTSGYGAVA